MAGSPTDGQVDAQLQAAVAVLDRVRVDGTTNLLPLLATLESAGIGDETPAVFANESSRVRRSVAGAASIASAQRLLFPIMREYARLAGSPAARGGSMRQVMLDVWDYWVTNSKSVRAPTQTLGAATADGSNQAGSGSAYRLTVRSDGVTIWNLHGETKVLECVGDQNNGGRRHEEAFRAYGGVPGLDLFEVAGTAPLTSRIPSRHSGDDPSTGSMARNSSFTEYDSSATDTSLLFPGWRVSDVNDVEQSATAYRGVPGGVSEFSLKMTAAATVMQRADEVGVDFARFTPYFFGCRVRPNPAADGDIILHLGRHSTTIAVSSLTDDDFNDCIVPIGVNNWWENWNEDQLEYGVEWTGTAGEVLIDDLVLAPFTQWGGLWYFVWGSAVPFLASTSALPDGDRFTFVDVGIAPATAKIAWHLRRAGLQLPEDAAPSVADPS